MVSQANIVFATLIESLVSQASGFGPNIIEQIKYMTVCLRKIGQQTDL